MDEKVLEPGNPRGLEDDDLSALPPGSRDMTEVAEVIVRHGSSLATREQA